MNHFLDYSKYSLDTLYEMLTNMPKKEYPDRVQEIMKRIRYLERESSRPHTFKGNDKRLKYALLEKEERNILSQDPFACFRIVSWTYRDMLIGTGIILVFYSIGKIIGLYQHFGIKFLTIFYIFLIVALLQEVALFSYPYYVCLKREIWPLFPSISFRKLLSEVPRSFGFFFVLSLPIGLVIMLIGTLTKLPVKSPELWMWSEYEPINAYFVFFLILTITILPIIEEVFFRGFLYNALKNHMPIVLASVLQATVFAFAHPYDLMNRLSTFLIGIGLVIVYERRKNLVSPILVHCMINFGWALRFFVKWPSH